MAVSKTLLVAFLTICVCFLLFQSYRETMYGLHARREPMPRLEGLGSHDNTRSPYLMYVLANVVQQRNNFSKELNYRQKMKSQKECQASKSSVSSRGGWCAETSREDGGQHLTDKKLVPALAKFLKGTKVASFGDGPGRYKQLMLDTGLLKGYDAYDGAPFSEKTSEGRVTYLDLTLPQFGLPLYDWVLSLEVAEHIPREFEHIYIDNIMRHAKYGVILSWAVPGQGGHSHVNTRPFEYVRQQFEENGFVHDVATSQKLQRASSLQWLKRNVHVYRRKDLTNVDMLEAYYV